MQAGDQSIVYDRLKEITVKVGDGSYGLGDDFDLDSFRDDLEEITDDLD